VRKVSRYLHSFYLKCGICQLIDHAYDMRMSISCNYLVTVILNKLSRRIIRYGAPVRAV
jgi:hypothetical protein